MKNAACVYLEGLRGPCKHGSHTTVWQATLVCLLCIVTDSKKHIYKSSQAKRQYSVQSLGADKGTVVSQPSRAVPQGRWHGPPDGAVKEKRLMETQRGSNTVSSEIIDKKIKRTSRKVCMIYVVILPSSLKGWKIYHYALEVKHLRTVMDSSSFGNR